MRRTVFGVLMLSFAVLSLSPPAVQAQKPVKTKITIRAVAQDAKIIGDGVGGALITVVDAKSGETLAEGRQEGGTGDTQLIMTEPRIRGRSIYDTEGAAKFVAEIEIAEPTVVNISATGPLASPQATRSASIQLLVLPGQNIVGDGVVLTLSGFIVEILDPEPLQPLGKTIEVRARVEMMCGCPIQPDGMWDARTKRIVTRLKSDGVVVVERRMIATKTTSLFSAILNIPEPYRERPLELEVFAAQPGTTNFGRHAIPVGGSPVRR